MTRTYKSINPAPFSYQNITYDSMQDFLLAFGLYPFVRLPTAEKELLKQKIPVEHFLRRHQERRRLHFAYKNRPVHPPVYGPEVPASMGKPVRDIPLRKRIAESVTIGGKTYDNAHELATKTDVDYKSLLFLMDQGGYAVQDAHTMLKRFGKKRFRHLPKVATPLKGRKYSEWVRDETPFRSIAELARFMNISGPATTHRIEQGIPLNRPIQNKNLVTYQKKDYPSLRQLADAFDVPYEQVKDRRNAGWTLEQALGHEPVNIRLTNDTSVHDTNTPSPEKERFRMPRKPESAYTIQHATKRQVVVTNEQNQKSYDLIGANHLSFKRGDRIIGRPLSRRSVQFVERMSETSRVLRLIDIDNDRPFVASREHAYFSGVKSEMNGEPVLEVMEQLTWLDPNDPTEYDVHYVDEVSP